MIVCKAHDEEEEAPSKAMPRSRVGEALNYLDSGSVASVGGVHRIETLYLRKSLFHKVDDDSLDIEKFRVEAIEEAAVRFKEFNGLTGGVDDEEIGMCDPFVVD